MNTALPRVSPQSVSLTFVTGTLPELGCNSRWRCGTRLSDSQGSWDTHLYRTLLMAGIWFAFLTGALLSGVVTPHFGVWVLFFRC
jgi:uncharacterized membrane protein YoaK (UPF0700 family)